MTPLGDLIGQHVELTRAGDTLHGACPFCADPRFRVGTVLWHCLGRGQHGNAVDFVMAIEGLDFAQALARLAEWRGP